VDAMQHSAKALAYADLILTNPLCEVTNPITGQAFKEVGPFWFDPWDLEVVSYEYVLACRENLLNG
jgi:hypothetical protein